MARSSILAAAAVIRLATTTIASIAACTCELLAEQDCVAVVGTYRACLALLAPFQSFIFIF